MHKTTICLILAVSSACAADPGDDSGAFASIGTETGSDTEDPDEESGGSTGGSGPIFDVGDESGTGPGEEGPDEPLSCDTVEDAETNAGCLFWAVDLPNWPSEPNGGGLPAADHQFAVVVANTHPEDTAGVQVYLGGDNDLEQETLVGPGELHVFKLPAQNIDPFQTTDDGIAYRIESDVPITAYQFNPLDNTETVYSNDASLLFPQHVLDTDYTAVTASGLNSSAGKLGAFVSVVATEDDTLVTLYPTAELVPGQHQDVMLDAGQVLTVHSVYDTYPNVKEGNLSGTRIESDRPVSVFSGNTCSVVPYFGPSACDHLEQQMLPLGAWGHRYAVAPPHSRLPQYKNEVAVVRITGAYDTTQLTYFPEKPPNAPASVDAYETIAFTTAVPFAVQSDGPDLPFAVTQFLVSTGNIIGQDPQNPQGDPAMVTLPAYEQYQDEYLFLVPDAYASNHVTAVLPVGAPLILDGQEVDGIRQPLGALAGDDHEFVHIAVNAGAHTMESSGPFQILVTGMDTFVSYAYPGGSGVASISEPPPPPEG
jgi:hypothetical protein